MKRLSSIEGLHTAGQKFQKYICKSEQFQREKWATHFFVSLKANSESLN